MYDFSQLSPADFEELTRDLLQKHWNVTLESFRNGRDGGIDLRYTIDSENGIIIQCKHYLRSGFQRLLHDLKDHEKPKVARISPARYVIVSSLPLNPLEKDKIFQAMHPYINTPADILGQETLNNLLRQHPDVERSHFKLWLSSTSVLDRILHSAIQIQTDFNVSRVQELIPVYVQGKSYGQALEILNERKFVIISGVPGIGKTTLADLLLFAHLEKSFEPVVIQADIADGRRLFNNERKQIFYFDDFLGETFLGRFDLVSRKVDSALLDFMELIKNSKHSRLVLTTREHILRQAFDISERFSRGRETLSVHQCVLELDDYTLTQRARILYNHLYFSDLPNSYKQEILRDRFYMRILKHRNYNPRLVEWLSKITNFDQIKVVNYRDELLRILDNPTHLWRGAYLGQISDSARSLLLALYSLGGGSTRDELNTAWKPLHQVRMDKYRFQATPEDWRSSLQDLEGGFLILNANRLSNPFSPEVAFINPSVKDFLDSEILANPANMEDLLSASTYFNQIIHLWSLAEAKWHDLTDVKQHAAPFIAAADRLGWRSNVLLPSNSAGGGFLRTLDAIPEVRLKVMLAIAERTRSTTALELSKSWATYLLESWQDNSPEFRAAVAVLRVLDYASWDALAKSGIFENLKIALLKQAPFAGSGDLAALIDYADSDTNNWFVEDDEHLAKSCEDYLSKEFSRELSDCSSESELSSLDEATSQIAGKCGASYDVHQEEIAARMAEYENPEIDDNDHPYSARTYEPSDTLADAQQEIEVTRLFDGLL